MVPLSPGAYIHDDMFGSVKILEVLPTKVIVQVMKSGNILHYSKLDAATFLRPQRVKSKQKKKLK